MVSFSTESPAKSQQLVTYTTLGKNYMADHKDYSGVLSCQDGLLSYKAEGADWSVEVSDIRLIGEFTTADGPYIDDYFFVFLTKLESGWHEASFYARGCEEALRELSEQLGSPLESGLCDSTHYKTRIMWPTKWKDQEMMEVLPPKKTGLLARVFDSGSRDIIPSKATREVFSE